MQFAGSTAAWKVGAAVAAVALAVTLAACGGGDDGQNGDDGGAPSSAASPAPTSDGDNGDDGEVSNDITLVSLNTLFDKSELRAEAGEITITHDNQDGGIVHDLAVFMGTDNKGELMGATELEAGPVTQTLTLNLEPGEYFYVCESHPATMSGSLTVLE